MDHIGSDFTWLNLLEQRVAEGEISKSQFKEIKHDLILKNEEIYQLQTSLDDSQILQWDLHEEIMRLTAENEELRIQEKEDRKRIQKLLGMNQPTIQENTYFQPCPSSDSDSSKIDYPSPSITDIDSLNKLIVALQNQIKDQDRIFKGKELCYSKNQDSQNSRLLEKISQLENRAEKAEIECQRLDDLHRRATLDFLRERHKNLSVDTKTIPSRFLQEQKEKKSKAELDHLKKAIDQRKVYDSKSIGSPLRQPKTTKKIPTYSKSKFITPFEKKIYPAEQKHPSEDILHKKHLEQIKLQKNISSDDILNNLKLKDKIKKELEDEYEEKYKNMMKDRQSQEIRYDKFRKEQKMLANEKENLQKEIGQLKKSQDLKNKLDRVSKQKSLEAENKKAELDLRKSVDLKRKAQEELKQSQEINRQTLIEKRKTQKLKKEIEDEKNKMEDLKKRCKKAESKHIDFVKNRDKDPIYSQSIPNNLWVNIPQPLSGVSPSLSPYPQQSKKFHQKSKDLLTSDQSQPFNRKSQIDFRREVASALIDQNIDWSNLDREEAFNLLRDQSMTMQRLLTQRIEHLEQSFSDLMGKYRQLQLRRISEVEGYGSEVKLLREQVKSLEKKIHHYGSLPKGDKEEVIRNATLNTIVQLLNEFRQSSEDIENRIANHLQSDIIT